MDLRRNRKGMVAIVDALVCISILSIAAVGLFAFSDHSENEMPQAESIADDLFSMEFRACDLCDVSDTEVYPISVIICYCMTSGETELIRTFLKDSLDGLVPGYCGYSLTIECYGKVLKVERRGVNDVSSAYSSELNIMDIGTMSYELVIC